MRLSEQDASFLYSETSSGPMQTASIAVIKGALTFDEVFAHYAARIHLVPRLLERLVFVPMNLAHPKWVKDPDFDIANHIVHHHMPDGSTIEDGVAALSKLNEGIMDRNRPLWKFVVVTGIAEHTLVLQQVHHAMIDGASAVQMSTVLFEYSPESPAPEPPEAEQPAPLPSAMELMTEAMQENAQKAQNAWTNNSFAAQTATEQSRTYMRQAFDVMSRFLTRPSITAPWNASLIGPKRRLTWTEHQFSEFRDIRRAFGGTINDVALAIVTEGCARYLANHAENAKDQYFRIMCPVNVRTEAKSGALGNQVSAIFPMLPAFTQPIVTRLQTVIEETTRIKNDQDAQAMTFMQESGASIPAMAMAPLLMVGTPFDPTRFAAANPLPVLPKLGDRPPGFGVNFVLTNVPGVQVPQYIAGKEMIATLAFMMLTGNMGLGIAVTSYNQKMIFNFTADPRLIPDLTSFTEQVSGAFEDLLEAARKQDETAAA